MNFIPVYIFSTLNVCKKLIDFFARNNLTADIFPLGIKRKLSYFFNHFRIKIFLVQ